jgi:hypothetical protein
VQEKKFPEMGRQEKIYNVREKKVFWERWS